jgi:D-beta-D-heptose 7-phosphate kinase/D-beta-D-heptose 1-phosphate adenosyltransferase
MKVWVNGTFDVLHKGHIELFRYANTLGDVRVGIDTDKRVKELKGNDRPINSFEDRKYFLESIKYIDSVVGFGTNDELKQQITIWKSDIMVIGSDYKNKNIIGSHLFKNIYYFDRIKGFSSTNIINYGKNISNR